MQSRWASILNPVIANPLVNGFVLNDITLLSSGPNVINHKLGRKLQGWIIVGVNAQVFIYDAQATNQTPALTLVLFTSSDCKVNLYVF